MESRPYLGGAGRAVTVFAVASDDGEAEAHADTAANAISLESVFKPRVVLVMAIPTATVVPIIARVGGQEIWRTTAIR